MYFSFNSKYSNTLVGGRENGEEKTGSAEERLGKTVFSYLVGGSKWERKEKVGSTVAVFCTNMCEKLVEKWPEGS